MKGCRDLAAQCAALVVAALCLPATAATINGGAGNPVMVMDDCCKVILNPAPVTPLPAGGAAAIAMRAQILADYPVIPGANVVVGAAAPGTLDIDVYAAVLYGCNIEVRYNDAVAGPSWKFPPPFPGGMAPSYRFSQKINTNMPLGGVGGMYIDPRPNDDPGGLPLPYYETDREAARFSNGANGFGGYDLWFWDKPRRPCKNTHTTWQADLFVVDENRFTVPGADPLHVITIHDGFRYGFEIWPKKLYRRNLTLSDLVVTTGPTLVTWSQAMWTNNLMTPTVTGITYPGGIVLPPGPPPPPFVITHPDSWPPVNIAPDRIDFGTTFIHPILGVSASTDFHLVNLHDVNDLGDNWNITVPLLISPSAVRLDVQVDLSKNLISVRDVSTPTTSRQNLLNSVIAIDMFNTFDPSNFGLQVIGDRVFQFGLLAIEHPRGDMDGDQRVTGLDIQEFIHQMFLLPSNQDPNLVPFGDFNMDAQITPMDIDPFVAALLGQ